MILQSLRMTQRDWRAGELRFLLVALIVAVAALSSVGFFVDRMRAGLTRDAHQLLGADLLVAADQPLSSGWRAEAQRRGLTIADTVVFPSMALAGDGDDARSQLASLKAVSPGYPLRGTLSIANTAGGPDSVTRTIPAAGTVWVDPNILTALNIQVGAHLKLGDRTFTIAHILSVEPDRGSGFVNFSPRVMLALADLASTHLVQDGSRVTYRLLLSGAVPQVQAFQAWVETEIARDNVKGVRIESLETGRPEMRATLDRAQQFLSLVGLLSAMLAAVAVAMAARRFMLRHLDACAMLRCLGLTQNQVTQLYLYEFLLIGLIGSIIGALVGYVAHFVLLESLGKFVSHDLPSASIVPGVQGVVTGLLLLVGFALPPILQLRNVPHNRVIRREQDAPQVAVVATYGLGTLTFVGLLLWQAGDAKLALLTALGFLGCFIVFGFSSWLALKSLRRLRGALQNPSWRFALTGLQRRPGATIVQIVALALGLMALLLLTVIRGDLIGAWRQSTPADAPNRFVINIQPDQLADINRRLVAADITQPNLYPMIRGRLIEINGNPIKPDTYQDDRAKRLVEREFNLSTMAAVPPKNQIVAGRWYKDDQPEASVEEGLAKTLHLKLGDKLTFDIAGQTVSAPITSLRKLEWGSMQVNFFVILNPKVMVNTPQTWITAFRLPPLHGNLGNQLTRDFPNLTVVDIGSIIQQLQDVVDQVVAAVEFLFLFTLASGGLVLYAALLSSQDERTREAGLLRALGATRRQLSHAQWIEFALIGSLAGFLAATGAAATGWALAHYVFSFTWTFSPFIWIAGMVIGATCTFLGGWISLRGVLSRPPLETLREA
ncbi:ABC transporter permease [Glaciimonas immobilis]|uniref:Putative ABC transport system permease protein n=1 Tax=Glaciimonas immobilis TaxID=728004 RepID=A0A840RS22_9BURK|nr:FtsX-like permease family protein [Glaciimonas immobilis]KAF3997935.1 FtsX-like permease family protein [Glaciimonas immobilis]MBB5199401.1 putative ABC transport system permease protein [Glaciimonas immobilis]